MAARLDARRSYDDALKARIDLEVLRQWDDLGTHDRLRPRNVYILRSGADIDIKLGWFPLNLGKADVINPTDFFVGYDFTALQPLEADQRLSRLAIKLDYRCWEGRTLSFIAAPRVDANKLPQEVQLSRLARSAHRAQPLDLSVRLESQTTEMDWSLSAFHGNVRNPILVAEESTLKRGYATQNSLGADAAWSWGNYVLKAEASSNWIKRVQEGTTPHGYFFSVLGLERSWGSLNAGVQWLYRRTYQWRDPASESDLLEHYAATSNAVTFGQNRSVQTGGTLRLTYKDPASAADAELFTIIYRQPYCAYQRASMGYKLSDEHKVSLGVERYLGSRSCAFGELDSNNTTFLEYQAFF